MKNRPAKRRNLSQDGYGVYPLSFRRKYYFSKNRCRIAAASARVVLPKGSSILLPLPEINPVPTAQRISSLAQPETAFASANTVRSPRCVCLCPVVRIAAHDCRHFLTGDMLLRRKLRIGNPCNNSILRCPADSLGIIRIFSNIIKI